MYTSLKPYPYLPEGRAILYVPSDHPFMIEARRMCETRSTDKGHPTGAVIVKRDRVIGRAANQAGVRLPALVRLHEGFCLRRRLGVPSGTHYWLCPGCASPRNHSEALAVRDARRENDPHDTDLYLYGHWWCCKPCWQVMIGAGVRNVYLMEGATELFG